MPTLWPRPHTATPSTPSLHVPILQPRPVPTTPIIRKAAPLNLHIRMVLSKPHTERPPGHTPHLHGTAHSPAMATPTRSSPSPNISPTPKEQIPAPGTSSCGGFQGCLLGSGLSRRLLVLVRSVGAGPPPALQPAAAPVSPCAGLELPRGQDPLPTGWDPEPPGAQAAPRTRSRSQEAAGRGCGCAASGTGCAGSARRCRLPGRGTWPAGTARARTAPGDEGGVRTDRLPPATCSGPRSVPMCGPSSDSAVSQIVSPICPYM